MQTLDHFDFSMATENGLFYKANIRFYHPRCETLKAAMYTYDTSILSQQYGKT